MKQGREFRFWGKRTGIPYILLVLGIISLFLPIPARAEEPYHLGHCMAFTGTGAVSSKECKTGVDLAVEEINKQGGFLGKHPIKLFVRDDLGKPDIGVRESKDLILRDKVRAIVGTYSSAVALAIEEVCYEYKVLHIPANSNTEAMTVDNYSPYTYQVVPNTYMQAKAQAIAVAKIAKQKGWKTFVTLGQDYEWAQNTTKAFLTFMNQLYPEMKLVKQYWPKLGEKEYSAYITSIMADKPDFVYGCISGTDGFAWMSQGKSYGFFDKFPYSCLLSLTEMIEAKDIVPRGVIAVSRAPFYAHMEIPMMANFVKNYRAKYNVYPSDFAAMHYDAVYVLKQGIEKAGSIDTEKVKTAMKGMSVNTVRGKLSFRKIDNMLNCQSYVGIVSDDPQYPFPICHNLMIVSGEESWRPESEIPAIREKAGLAKKRSAQELKL